MTQQKKKWGEEKDEESTFSPSLGPIRRPKLIKLLFFNQYTHLPTEVDTNTQARAHTELTKSLGT